MHFKDQIGNYITLNKTPSRIISLVPSQTELLYELGAENTTIGITKFCVRPKEWFRNKTKIGGTKNINLNKIKSLNPDLIIGNKEENEQKQIEELIRNYPVWLSNIKTLNEATEMIKSIGNIIGKNKKAQSITNKIENAFKKITPFNGKNNRVAYIIWNNPIMCAGADTFINDMLNRCGFKNIFFGERKSRYPEITAERLKQLSPDFIFLSSEPFPFKEKHAKQFKAACPNAIIKFVDGELFSWYGSRLQYAPSYFQKIIDSISQPR